MQSEWLSGGWAPPPTRADTGSTAYTYFTTTKKDKAIYWWSVVILLVIDIFHSAISCEWMLIADGRTELS